MDKVNKKVLWLADYDLHQAMGGAQRSDKLIIDYGKKLGYKILKVNYETFGFHIDIHDYDILITSNLCALTIKHNALIDEITKHKYHVRLEHDSNTYLSQKDRIKLFGSCKKTFFLTEYHYEFFKKDYDTSDIRQSLVAAVAVRVQEPVFESQTKTKLGSQYVSEGGPSMKNFISDFLLKQLDRSEEHTSELQSH